MLRWLALFGLVWAGLTVPRALDGQVFVRGDVNSDGSIDLIDGVTILNWLFPGGPAPLVMDAADVNDNGTVEIADVNYLFEYFFVPGAPPPPPPFPNAGIDPTPPNFPSGPTGALTFAMDDVIGCGGDEVVVPVYVDNTVALSGLSFRIIFDPYDLTNVSTSSDPLNLLLSQFPAFYSAEIDDPGELRVGILFSFMDPPPLAAGTNQHILDLTFEIDPAVPDGQVYPITFEDDPLAVPAEYNLGATSGQVELPSVTNGSITTNCGGGSGPFFKRGDVSGDGLVQIDDPIFLLNYLFVPGSAAPACPDTADIDDDGALGIGDAINLLNYLFVPGSPPPAAPGPASCGLDPTDMDPLPPCIYSSGSC